MSIDLDIYTGKDARGRITAVDVRATILSSPREGFDADRLAALECDLGTFITGRLNCALKNGGAK